MEELRESEARSRIVMETVADAVVTVDADGRILFVNRAAGRVFGYGAEEMLGADLTMLMPEYMRRLHEEGMRRYIETGVKHMSWDGVELPGLHRAGHEVPLEVSFGEFRFGGRRYFTGVIRDISELKRAEQRLAAQYEVTRALAEARTLKEVVPHVLRAVCEGLGWDYGALWRVERGGERPAGSGREVSGAERLRFVESWHGPASRAEEVLKFSRRRDFGRDEGLLSAKVWAAGQPLWVEDIAADPSFLRSAAAAADGLHAALAFPVLLYGEVLGVMEFFSHNVRAPDESMLRMLGQVGSQLGQVIERRQAEEEQARLREEIIRVQDELLAELSSPLVPLTPEVVLMPLVGAVDARRARCVIESLLGGLERTRAPVAIIDITGVPFVDAQVADTLVRASQAARLLGTQVVLTGIRAGVARALVGLGLDPHTVATRKTLQEGIRYAFERLRGRATKL